MLKRSVWILLLSSISITARCQVQGLDLYQYNYTTISPGFAGIDGIKVTAIGNLMTFDGGQKRSAAFLGFEGALGKVGGGFSYSRFHSGATTYVNFNLPFNYQFKIGETRKFVAGARLSYQTRKDDLSYYKPLDPNDPLLDSGGEIRQSFLAGLWWSWAY